MARELDLRIGDEQASCSEVSLMCVDSYKDETYQRQR